MSEEFTQRSARSFSQTQLTVSEEETPDLKGWLMLKGTGKTWIHK